MNFTPYTTKSADDVLREFSTSHKKNTFGPNILHGKETHWYDVFLRQFRSPFLYLLLIAALISFFLREFLDGLMIVIFVGINTALGFLQEYKSEQTLKLLKQYVVTRCRVIRNGVQEEIITTDLVPGDMVVLQPGDIIPADVRFTETENMQVDESILTGESVTILKTADPLKHEAKEIYEATNIGFSGTSVISGKGVAVVIATGQHTVIGNISSLTTETSHISSFEKEIAKLSAFILKLILITLAVIVMVNILIKGSTHIPTLVIFAIALAISVIPEALPVVTTFSFSRGAQHLAKHKVVVKRLSAIEDIGSINVLCTDKTGTITENKLTVANVHADFPHSLLYACLATPIEEKLSDPFDIAVFAALSAGERNTLLEYKKLAEIPFDPLRRHNSVAVKKNGHTEIVVRGAFENIMALCKRNIEHAHINFGDLQKWVNKEGEEGRRVLALARKTIIHELPSDIGHEEHVMEFIGVLSFVDPLKKTSHAAIAQAKALGVRIKILTGDSREVAAAVAFETGLIADIGEVISGDELDRLSASVQQEAVEKYAVFARVSPQQKHEIIKLLQEKNEVGFLGEGINDAPALKAANVAIVVQGASDIAQDAADIVLLNKSLHVIIDGIKEGREIFGNTAKYIKATLASNFGNFYTVAIASLFINFLPLLPLQILLINLLTDFPMISVATDNVDVEDLRRPKNYDIKGIALFATVMGVVSSFFDFLFFVLFYRISPSVLQTNWFIGSVLTELVFIFSIRSRLPVLRAVRPSSALIVLSAIAFIAALALPFTYFGQSVFAFVRPTAEYIFLIMLIVGSYFAATELAKNIYYKFTANS